MPKNLKFQEQKTITEVNNEGQVALRFVLFLLYLEQTQMIDRIINKTTSVFIYLTTTGGAMLNASPFHKTMLVNDSF